MSALNDTLDVLYHPVVVVELHLRLDRTLHGLNSAVDAAGYGQQKFSPGGSIQTSMLFDGSVGDDLDFLVYVTPTDATWEFPAHRISGTWTCKFAYQDLPVDPRIFSAVGVSIYADCVTAERFSQSSSNMPLIDLSNGCPADGMLPDQLSNLIMTGPADMISMSHDENGSYLSLSGRDMRATFIDSPFPPENIAKLNMAQQIDVLIASIIAMHPLAKDMLPPKLSDDTQVDYFVSEQAKVSVPTAYNPDSPDNSKLTYDELVAAIVGSFLRINDDDWLIDGKVVLPAPLNDAKPVPRVRKSAKASNPPAPKTSSVKWAKNKTRASAPTNEQTTFWDMITQCCYLVSAIPVFYGSYLYIRNSLTMQNLARYADGAARPTIFKNGETRYAQGMAEINLPVMLYGSNLSSFKIERKLQGRKAMAVRVMAYDTSSKEKGLAKYREVEWPPTPIASKDSPSGRGAEASYIRVRAPGGITDTKALEAIGEAIFKETMRSEISGSFETKNLASLGGGNSDPDLLRLRPGAAIVVDVSNSRFDSFPPYISTLVRDRSISEGEATAQIMSILSGNVLTVDSEHLNKNSSTIKGAPLANFARALVRAQRGSIVELPKTFYVSTVHVAWSTDSGMRISADFINYIEAQIDKAVAAAEPAADKYNWEFPPGNGMDHDSNKGYPPGGGK